MTTPLAAIVTTDLTAITRGRFVPARKIESLGDSGVGWVPANLSLKPDGHIIDGDIWGSSGDLRLLPDLTARYATALTGAPTPFDMTMGNLTELDGTPWSGCARSALIATVEAFESATGLTLLASFEQEFQLFGADWAPAHVFSYQALRRAEPFAGQYFAALGDAGIDPEVLIAEYGENQYEVTSGPTDPLAAADRCIAIREITREMARLQGWRATFAPKTAPEAVGNGVHIHLSLCDGAGQPVTFDPAGPGRLSKRAGAFFAGILHHMRAITALTAASPASYLRLKPHNWSSAWTWMSERDREATLRICPTVEVNGRDPSAQFNVEYRAADATANPYLALTALVRAGLDGLQRDLAPVVWSGDPETLPQAERTAKGIDRLPESLSQALDLMQASEAVARWFPAPLLRTFDGVKRAEIADAAGLDDATLCAQTAAVY